MTVQVATCSAEQLFSKCLSPSHKSGEVIVSSEGVTIAGDLAIPEYQRPYCWRDTQIDRLLDDISSHTKQHPELPYYLGSLILHQTVTENGKAKLNIIDGQQRITTLALISCLQEPVESLVSGLLYEHPISQQQIKHNLGWLKNRFSSHSKDSKALIDLNKLQFTLVVTQSEDDAYRFFETQNTGGVRLGGPDIIKAHHLRAINKLHQPMFAQQWEALGTLDNAINALLKGRYWQQVNYRSLPPHQQTKQLRDSIVWELAEQTGDGKDIAYGRFRRLNGLAGEVTQKAAQQGYEVRQPLNAGINSVRYISYFQKLYKHYWEEPDLPHLDKYQSFVMWLKGIEGCGYLQSLYEACLLLYISHFGESHLEEAAKKLFRVVYSRRVSNQKAVRENSIPNFIKEHPVLDWIALSYTPEQCFSFFDNFELTVDPSNLDKNSVKKRFMDKVNKQFGLGLTYEQFEKEFATALTVEVAGGE